MSDAKAAWLIEQLKRDDLPPEVRKRYANRLKQQKTRHPQPQSDARADLRYTTDAWKRLGRRRKLAKASKRRNRGN